MNNNHRTDPVIDGKLNNEDGEKSADIITVEENLLPAPGQITKAGLKDDWKAICLLLALYAMQGIVVGFVTIMPMLLQKRKVPLTEQAKFSVALYPYSIKLLWAPLVDSIFVKKFGRRKTWFIPCQILLGSVLIGFAFLLPDILDGTGDHPRPNVLLISLIYFVLVFLSATQDIAVDGLAISILSKKNVSFASTCNWGGLQIGVLICGYVYLWTVDYIPLKLWAYVWGCMLLIVSTIVYVTFDEHNYRRNNADDDDIHVTMGLRKTYMSVFTILRRRPAQILTAILLTEYMSFSATSAITNLRLIDVGISLGTISTMLTAVLPVQIILPWLLAKWTTGKRPLNILFFAFPYRLMVNIAVAFLLWQTPKIRDTETGKFLWWLYALWVGAFFLQAVAELAFGLATFAFMAQIADPTIGGTYFTLLATFHNLGAVWPRTVVQAVTNQLTWKGCYQNETQTLMGQCNTPDERIHCFETMGASCQISIDGYYISVGICTIIGLIWLGVCFRPLRWLQNMPREHWELKRKKPVE